ncbi:MAG: 5'-deoxynucleotidase [Solobacterium sp.]|nr:5'-deoxynucleotidase [Solobacterium sp.]MBR3203383.1 5'-deoxynucleotidase [Solobacterium sp.]
MDYHFFATVSRMKYIERWALMRSGRRENLSEHSLEVAMIAHALCLIGNERFGRHLNAEKAALAGLYHDVSEIITGDMPTPVKYGNDRIHDSYKEVEKQAVERLLKQLPDDLRPHYEAILRGTSDDPEEQYMFALVKAADKLSALIKCMEEKQMQNREFEIAYESTLKKVNEMAAQYPEIQVYMDEFLPSYGEALDTLLGN